MLICAFASFSIVISVNWNKINPNTFKIGVDSLWTNELGANFKQLFFLDVNLLIKEFKSLAEFHCTKA